MSKFKPSRNNPLRHSPVRAPKQSVKTAGPAVQEPEPGIREAQQDTEINQPNAIQNLGSYAVLVFVFFRFSFLHEFIAAKVSINLHLIIVLGGVSYLCWLLSGQLFRGFKERSSWMWLGFLICMVLATVTSFWKGGSFPLMMGFLQTVFPVVLVIPAVVSRKPQLMRMVSTMGLASLVTVLLGTINDDFRSGRMGVDVANSDIQNPNDYAAYLVLMLPALAYWGFRQGRSIVFKVISAGAMALCLKQILSSGSRGALLSLVITAVFVLLTGPKKLKMAILIGVPALGLAAIPFVPAESLLRLSTLFSSQAAAKNGEAAESSEARLALLQESWKTTLQHPLLGVGPGIFMDYQANAAGENGQRGMWHVTHNAYTQVSSECGLPALIFYVSAIGLTFASLRKCIKSGDPELAPAAATISVMLVGFCVCIFFLSLAYSFHLTALSAITVAMKLRLAEDGKLGAGEAVPVAHTPEAVPA